MSQSPILTQIKIHYRSKYNMDRNTDTNINLNTNDDYSNVIAERMSLI